MNTIYVGINEVVKQDNKDFLNFYKQYNKKINFVIIADCELSKLLDTQKAIKSLLGDAVEIIRLSDEDSAKRIMSNGVYIDNCCNLAKVNIDIKIAFDNPLEDYSNTSIMFVKSWGDIKDIIDFYTIYNYKTLNKK